MRRDVAIIPTLLLVLAACTPAAPAGLSDADKAAIEAQGQSFGKMAVAGDYAALVKAYYTPDAIMLAPNTPSATGPAAIEAILHTFPPVTAMTLHNDEVAGAGDMAWVRGRYAMMMAPPGAAPVADSGKFIEIFKKGADGSWKSYRDMFNSDLPAEPAPAPTAKKGAPAKK